MIEMGWEWLNHPLVIASIIGLAGTVVTAAAGIIAVLVKVGGSIERRVRSVEDSVNHRTPDQPTLYRMVQALLEQAAGTRARMAVLYRQGSRHGKKIDELLEWKRGSEGRHDSAEDRLDALEREEELDRQRLADLEAERVARREEE